MKRTPTRDRVLHVMRAGSIELDALAERIQAPRATISDALRLLVSDKLIERTSKAVYQLTPAGRAALETRRE